MKNQIALITGASSGIGYDLRSSSHGIAVCSCLWREAGTGLLKTKKELEAVAPISVLVIEKDLAEPGAADDVASIAAFQRGPYMAVYYASKAYVLSCSEAIAYELNGTGVTVTVLCHGPTDTGFATAAGLGNTRLFTFVRRILRVRSNAERQSSSHSWCIE